MKIIDRKHLYTLMTLRDQKIMKFLCLFLDVWPRLYAASNPSQANYLPKLFQVFTKSFSLIEYDLWILSSVFLIDMFDLRGKDLKYAKTMLLNHYRKSVQKSMRLQDMCR